MPNKLAVAGPNSVFKEAEAKPAGFWAGYWHGLIAPITLVVSLFNADVRVYETNNSGTWYDVGFVLGLAGSLGKGFRINVGRGREEEES